jgi:hypothetical protein
MSNEPSYFIRVDEHRFVPQHACAGAWRTSELHIAPVNGLLLHELERWLGPRADDGKHITRISLDYLGVFDFTACEVAIEMLRPGRAVELIEVIVSQHGRAALRGRVWRVAATDTSEVAGGALDPLPGPEEAGPFDMTEVWPGDFIDSLDTRAVDGPIPGQTTAWITTPLPIVAGDATTDLSRYVMLIDTTNGIAVRRHPEEWQFPNVDLTIHLFRQPEGAWAGFETRVIFGDSGHGITGTNLYDERGHVGRADQALLVRPRRNG